MFGNLFNHNRPSGNPLDPSLAERPLGALGTPQAPLVPQPALMAPAAPQRPPVAPALTSIPTPPASIKRKKLNMWDKEHISATLAEISKGFLSGGNFLQGLGAAGQNVAGLNGRLNAAQKGSTEIGGPDNAFEITTDADGNRSFRRIAEVQEYLDGKEKAKNAPKPKDTDEYVGDMSYAIEQLDPAQRPGAYQLMREQAKDAGHNVSRWPDEYSPTFAKAAIGQTIGARQGSANEATRLNRAEVNADRDASRESVIAAREAATARAIAASGRAAEGHARRMRGSPPSTRRSKNSDLDYLR